MLASLYLLTGSRICTLLIYLDCFIHGRMAFSISPPRRIGLPLLVLTSQSRQNEPTVTSQTRNSGSSGATADHPCWACLYRRGLDRAGSPLFLHYHHHELRQRNPTRRLDSRDRSKHSASILGTHHNEHILRIELTDPVE